MRSKANIKREEARELLHWLYWDRRKSTVEIGSILNASKSTVWGWLRYHHISIRDYRKSGKNKQIRGEKNYNWRGGGGGGGVSGV